MRNVVVVSLARSSHCAPLILSSTGLPRGSACLRVSRAEATDDKVRPVISEVIKIRWFDLIAPGMTKRARFPRFADPFKYAMVKWDGQEGGCTSSVKWSVGMLLWTMEQHISSARSALDLTRRCLWNGYCFRLLFCSYFFRPLCILSFLSERFRPRGWCFPGEVFGGVLRWCARWHLVVLARIARSHRTSRTKAVKEVRK